jgi:WD40 repeat protein
VALPSESASYVTVADLESGKREVRLETPGDVGVQARFSPDGEWLVTSHRPQAGSGSGGKACVRIWRWQTSELVARLEVHDDPVLSVEFDDDGRRMLLASADRTATLWNTADWSLVRRFGTVESSPPATGEPARRRFSTSCRAVFAVDPNHVIHTFDNLAAIWDLYSGDRVRTLEIPEADPSRGLDPVIFDSKRRLVAAVAHPKGELHVWDVETADLLLRRVIFTANRRAPTAVRMEPKRAILEFSPDGRFLLLSLPGGKIEVLLTATWSEPWLTLGGSDNFVTAATFAPDGKSVVCAMGLSGQLLRVPLDVAASARDFAPRELTPDERDRFEIGTASERAAFRQAWEHRAAQKTGR